MVSQELNAILRQRCVTGYRGNACRADRITLSSAGAGVRLHFPAELEADAGIAFPLDYRAIDNESRDPHPYFSLSKSFKLCPDRTRLHCS